MRNFLLFQIDSAPLDVIQKAVKGGYMPFFKSLIDKGWQLNEMFCGIPSTTPASQINLFYGFPLLPGFRFVMKKEKVVFAPQYVETLNLLENSVYLKDKKGLLRDGLGIFSLFAGGSDKSISMDMVTKNRMLFFRFLLFFFNPFTFIWRILRIFVILIIERIEYNRNRQANLLPKSSGYVWYRMIHEIIFGEIGLMTLKKEIKSNNKVIFINFTGYDEISHHHGAYSKSAFSYLSIIDLYLQETYREIEKNLNERVLIVMSDHGQTPCIPETSIISQTIGEKIASLYPEKRIVQHQIKYKNTLINQSDLYLANSGSVCLVYNMKKTTQFTKEELEKDFPDFCKKVSNLDTVVDMVLAREKGIVAIKDGGKYDFTLKNANVLFQFLDTPIQQKAIEWLTIFMNGPYAPDVCILGKMLEKNKMVNFEYQLSTHGGIGGFQTQSFLLSREKLFPENLLPEIRDLHDVIEKNVYY
jgi:hypothetical protein